MDQAAAAGLHDKPRLVLNDWDPLNVADLVPDEYDGLSGRSLGRLAQAATSTEMGEFPRFEMEELFGIDPAGCDADKFGARLATWYAAKQVTEG